MWCFYNSPILVYNTCLISISNSVSDQGTKISVLNTLKGHSIDWLSQGIRAWYIENVLSNAGFKTQKLTKMYELISAFVTQKFCSFWKPISPLILHPKSQQFYQLLSFTSSLIVCSPFMSSLMPSLYKVVCQCGKNVNNDISKGWPRDHSLVPLMN